MTNDGLSEYWAVNNHAPDCLPSGRPEIHADWLSARESLAVDMASWAAFVDGQADRVNRSEGRPTMTERVEEVIGGELAGLQPGSDFTATFTDNATPFERTFTLEHMPAIPMIEAGSHQQVAGDGTEG
jgi:hypothetical protein